MNMEANYNANMYLLYDDLNEIENKVDAITKEIQENIYDNKSSPLSSIEVGDNLNGKTLYLSFPRDSYEYIPYDNKSSQIYIIKTSNGCGIRYQYDNSRSIINVSIHYTNANAFLYAIYVEDNNPYLNYKRFVLPDDFGIVTEINTDTELYEYIQIYKDENIIPNYVKKDWVENEFPYMQDIDNIEQGIKNIGDYFTKPLGWIETKDWLGTISIYNRYNYGVDTKPFSYQDINRWITDLNLIEQEDMENVTLWNTYKSEYYWQGHTNYIQHKVLYNDEQVQYEDEDLEYYYLD